MDKNSGEFIPLEPRAQAAKVDKRVKQMMTMVAQLDEKMGTRMEKMDQKMDARDVK